MRPTFTWIEEATLMESHIRMYQGTFKSEDGSHVEIPMIPREMVDYTRMKEMAGLLEHLDLHRFFESPQPAIDTQRIWELVTTIQESGIARVSDLGGTRRSIIITPELVAATL